MPLFKDLFFSLLYNTSLFSFVLSNLIIHHHLYYHYRRRRHYHHHIQHQGPRKTSTVHPKTTINKQDLPPCNGKLSFSCSCSPSQNFLFPSSSSCLLAAHTLPSQASHSTCSIRNERNHWPGPERIDRPGTTPKQPRLDLGAGCSPSQCNLPRLPHRPPFELTLPCRFGSRLFSP